MFMKKPTFISLQGSYSSLELSLFIGSNCIEKIKENNLRASSLLIPKINDLLQNNSLELKDLDFIAVDQGPGAFTSLRVVITIVNALSFAKKIPLIGIDGLDALYNQALEKTDSKNIVVILNAYNNDVYFAVNKNSEKHTGVETFNVGVLEKGYKKIDKLLLELKEQYKDSRIVFAGNACKQHENLISKDLNYSFINLETASSEQIAKMALERWNSSNKGFSYKLKPLYLKSQSFKISSKNR